MSDTINRVIDAQNNLVVQHSDFSLRALHDMASGGAIDLAPEYQRRDRWRAVKQSALIESFILNVPVPPVYLSEDDFGRYSVIDGKQRITAIRAFLSGELKLVELKKFKELEGCRYSDLPDQIKNALSVRPYIRVIMLLKQTDPQLKYEVFLRLNTGGEKLLPQEIRNVAFSGPLNDLLLELSSASFLWERMKIKGKGSPAYRSMEDVEHVLRFFTIGERWSKIGQVLAEEMDSFMRDNRKASTGRLNDLRHHFALSLEACQRIWGKKAFYKPQGNGWREQFISPLFDAEMVAVSLFKPNQIAKIEKHKAGVMTSTIEAFKNDAGFVKSVTQSTNNPSSVKKRVQTVREILEANL
jgi:uncharacterized protein with ParB-like and HNH nuclease domain